MLRDYLRSFWRGVLHNKVATLINVGGLALGLAVFFALTFYVEREFSWDAHWPDAERIFRITAGQESPTGNIPAFINQGPWVLGTALQTRHPDAFDVYARVYFSQHTVTVDEKEFPFIGKSHAEASLLDLIPFETVAGSLEEVFSDPSAIALDWRTAERIFGTDSPLDATITFKPPQTGNINAVPPPARDYVVKAVFRLEQPTNFSFTVLAGLDPNAPPQTNTSLDMWQGAPQQFRPPDPNQPPPPPPITPLIVQHYVKVREGVDIKAIEADLRAFTDENHYQEFGTTKQRYYFQNMQDVHLMPTPFQPADNVARLLVYAAIGTLVLIISGCNFVMLATLRLVDRMREVGIRKSAGAGGGQLMRQYLLDAFCHVLLAAMLAVMLLQFGLPKLQTMLQLPADMNLLNSRNLLLCLLMVALFTLVSSLYPAWMTSQAKPAPLLRNGASAVVGTGTGLRKLLVGIQFAIVVVLLLATAVVRQQIDYTRNRDPGYSLENVIQVRASGIFGGDSTRSDGIVAAFEEVEGVGVVAPISMAPGVIFLNTPTLVKVLDSGTEVREAGLQSIGVGPEFFRAMSVKILAGREFSRDLDASMVTTSPPPPDAPLPERRVVLNESAARLLGFGTPDAAIEQLLDYEIRGADQVARRQAVRVIGVVADTQFSSAMLPPVAQMYPYQPTGASFAVKLAAGTDIDRATNDLREAWERVVPGIEFITQDGSASFAFQLAREEFEARIITGSTLLAILIALLGLYGLVAATVVKRVKEIGVRKVMGAERKTIVALFLWQFSKPIVVANLIAWPFGFWAITRWLQRFPYQLDMPIIVLSGFAASVVALLIAWLTVGAMAAKASGVKPVLALRYE